MLPPPCASAPIESKTTVAVCATMIRDARSQFVKMGERHFTKKHSENTVGPDGKVCACYIGIQKYKIDICTWGHAIYDAAVTVVPAGADGCILREINELERYVREFLAAGATELAARRVNPKPFTAYDYKKFFLYAIRHPGQFRDAIAQLGWLQEQLEDFGHSKCFGVSHAPAAAPPAASPADSPAEPATAPSKWPEW